MPNSLDWSINMESPIILLQNPPDSTLSPRHFKGAIAVNNPVSFVIRFQVNLKI
ncbi:MAG: hypothetical protein RIG27_13705 [Coleofasciculus sp. F4-SAH-05]